MKNNPKETQKNEFATTAEYIRKDLWHSDISIDDQLRLRIRRLEAAEEESQFWTFNLSDVFLPANSIYPSIRPISDFPELSKVLVLCAQRYLETAGQSKSRTTRVRGIIYLLSMALEYLWIQDVTKFADARPYHFENLVKSLASGGWLVALNIQERIHALASHERSMLFETQESVIGKHVFTYRQTEIRKILGTNIRNFRSVTAEPVTALEERDGSLQNVWGASRLNAVLSYINIFYDIGADWGLSFPPYIDSNKLAKKLARPPSRTKNINVGAASIMLKSSASWIYEYGPLIADLIEEVSKEVVECRMLTRKYMGKRLRSFFETLPTRLRVVGALPFPIEYLDFGRRTKERSHSLRTAVLCLITACYVTIATMNGRRKDEIGHRKFGLRRGDLKVISEELELYQIDFYIEKTYQERIPFYVNKITADAVRLLERLEDAFYQIDVALFKKDLSKNRPLFCYRRFSLSKGVGERKQWYAFSTSGKGNEEDAMPYLRLAFGDGDIPAVSSHMFRRIYALIFYYQYENADLQALMYQLGHFDLASTMIYITDPSSRPESEQISECLDISSTEIQKVRQAHVDDLNEELAIVRDEKFEHEVFAILNGETRLGGYERFVRRVHLKLATAVEINSERETGTPIVGILKQRGHFPRPMRHGQCMAGSTLSIKSARCLSSDKLDLDRSRANAHTCGTCMFHLTSEPYLSNIDADLREIEHEMENLDIGSLMFEQKRNERDNVREALSLLRGRIHEKKNI
ncbi:hypothetical protein [Herbaspirillum sp. YR522]|uniref:hypothetical protein n=1 Tax=Herbaspirillum sp. YR522 TaxID=1144342 RepID=UPI00026F6D57|nr:hypothetical protein [Herbaspirillum sp. YR522]EJN10133.1 hypothetical protein PMI40_00220 [Herbaspirillum sp. YR522]